MSRRIATLAAILMALFGTIAAPAHAATTSIVIVQGGNIRQGPGTQHPVIGSLRAGTVLTKERVACYAHGERIGGGPGVGTDIWWMGNYGGVTGYYSSYLDNVPMEKQGNIEGYYGIPNCKTPGYTWSPERYEGFGRYDRQRAAAWALAHARDRQPDFYPCTWFASRALWAGGLDRTPEWTDAKPSGNLQKLPGTSIAVLADALTTYLLETRRAHKIPLRGLETSDNRFRAGNNAIPEAEIGDLIAYDWNRDREIDHLAVIVAVKPGKYPSVSDWGLKGGRNSQAQHGWTWSAISSRWLEEVNGGPIWAYLLKIRA